MVGSKWLTCFNEFLQVSYGGYKLGANSANILVQDRQTGIINEERMSVYVRLGIRLLYKGLKGRKNMESKKGKSASFFGVVSDACAQWSRCVRVRA